MRSSWGDIGESISRRTGGDRPGSGAHGRVNVGKRSLGCKTRVETRIPSVPKIREVANLMEEHLCLKTLNQSCQKAAFVVSSRVMRGRKGAIK